MAWLGYRLKDGPVQCMDNASRSTGTVCSTSSYPERLYFGYKCVWLFRRKLTQETFSWSGSDLCWNALYTSWIKTVASSCLHHLWRWYRQSIPKRRHVKFRRQGITQKKEYKMNRLLGNIQLILQGRGGARWHSWLRHWAKSRKVAGSTPDGVIGIFSLT